MDETLALKNIPESIAKAVMHELSHFVVGFLKIEGIGTNRPILLGSGVLVSAGKTHAILTAHHVIECLEKNNHLGLLLGKSEKANSINTQGFGFRKIARGNEDSSGPDLGAVILAPNISSSIAAKKSFFNLDLYYDQMLTNPPELNAGFWISQGYLDERTAVTKDTDRNGITITFNLFNGLGSPEYIEPVDRFDYFKYPIVPPRTSPVSWGGMSGGGLWQIPLKRQSGNLTYLKPLLSGVLFYEQLEKGIVSHLKCHARKSIYEIAYDCIKTS